MWGQCWCGLLFFLLSFFPLGFCHVSFEICTVGPSFFPYLCLCLSAKRIPDKVRVDVNTSRLTKNAVFSAVWPILLRSTHDAGGWAPFFAASIGCRICDSVPVSYYPQQFDCRMYIPLTVTRRGISVALRWLRFKTACAWQYVQYIPTLRSDLSLAMNTIFSNQSTINCGYHFQISNQSTYCVRDQTGLQYVYIPFSVAGISVCLYFPSLLTFPGIPVGCSSDYGSC